jgi:hypothetical protein
MTNAAPSGLECAGAPRTGREHPPARPKLASAALLVLGLAMPREVMS